MQEYYVNKHSKRHSNKDTRVSNIGIHQYLFNFPKRTPGERRGKEREVSARRMIEERYANSNSLLFLGEEAGESKRSINDTPEGLQDISIGVGRVGVRRDNAFGLDLGMYMWTTPANMAARLNDAGE
jgi:hypothetical protein